MNNFLKFSRKTFSDRQGWYHGFSPEGNLKTTKLRVLLLLFDTARVFLYVFVGYKLITRLPGNTIFNYFNFRKATNNPEYRLLDETSFKNAIKH
jgi:hypothetical protein